jgi:4-hydroxybenzoate polyprenyltransferase
VLTAWADILAAHFVVTGDALQPVTLLWLLLSTSCLYWAGMVLNDCFDLPIDRRERPERPLPSGRIALRHAWLLGWVLLACGVAAAGLAGSRPLLIAVLLAAAVVAYDGWLKNHRIGPAAMGLCRYLNWLLGLSVVPLGPASFAIALPAFLYVTALTVLSRTEVTAADRRPVLLTGAGILASAASILGLLLAGTLAQPWALLALAVAVGLVIRDLQRTWVDFTPPRIRVAMRHLILGIVVLDAILVAAAGHWWGAVAVLLLLVPGRLLSRAIAVT